MLMEQDDIMMEQDAIMMEPDDISMEPDDISMELDITYFDNSLTPKYLEAALPRPKNR